ncbi:MAG TPA: protein phosphatase 2C domain-containing protein [Bryobacteraceae bacterium]|nr:protein phosphatase 2C domain-containing protein [Bryobacteraceae bacterium]
MTWLSMLWNEEEPPAGGPVREPVASLVTDTGCVRAQNEDSARIVRVGPCGHGDRGLLVVVADGMGGHEAGEVASQTAVEVIEKAYREAWGTPGEALAAAFQQAHEQILKMAARNPDHAGMGTTCTALAMVGGRAWAAHVGDSRIYLVRGGAIYQVSEDQTQCMEMVRQGLMTMEEAERHEDRNVLAHAMGTRRNLALTTWPQPLPLRPGDRFVLCSDGLHDLVSAQEILQVVRDAETDESCDKLLRMARQRGGFDNITVAVAAVPDGEVPAVPQRSTRECEILP